MPRMYGDKGQIELEPTGAITGGTPVGSMNKWTCSFARDKADVTAFQDTNKVYVVGLPDIKGTIGGWWDSAESPALFGVALGDVAAFLTLIPSTLEPTFLWKGPAWIDAAIDVSATGAVGITGSFVASGAWAMEPVGAGLGRSDRAGAGDDHRQRAA
jgi:hypothetical protein